MVILTVPQPIGNIMVLWQQVKTLEITRVKTMEALAEGQNKDGKFIIGEYDDYPTTVAFSMLLGYGKSRL